MLASLYQKALLTQVHKVGDLILIRIFYEACTPPMPPVVFLVLGAYHCTKKYFLRYLSCKKSTLSSTIAVCGIENASSKDLQHIINVRANSRLWIYL